MLKEIYKSFPKKVNIADMGIGKSLIKAMDTNKLVKANERAPIL